MSIEMRSVLMVDRKFVIASLFGNLMRSVDDVNDFANGGEKNTK